jgi:hypothetical protein
MRIQYYSAPAGSGKTHGIVNRACRLAAEHKRVFLLQPTKELISKTIQEELLNRPKRPEWKVFTQDHIPSLTSIPVEHNRQFDICDYLIAYYFRRAMS